MTGHSILYLGRNDFAAEYLDELDSLLCCERLLRADSDAVPSEVRAAVDIVLVEAAPAIAESSFGERIAALAEWPVIALTTREREHRGIAAVNAGAQAYILIDDVSIEDQEAVFEHVVERRRLEKRLSGTDSNVLSVLKNINDGVIVVDAAGRIIDINPAGRTILGLSPRAIPDEGWEQTFCCIDADGENYHDAAEQPLVRARRGEKFSGQLAVYRKPEQPDTLLALNGQGLYDGRRELVGGIVTFRDVTDSQRTADELRKLARYDELTGLANRGLFAEQLARAIGRAQRSNHPLAVLSVDLDKFRSVNETLGHDTGDALLCQVAGRLRKHLRIGDFPGRWGGDHFVVCLEEFGPSGNAAAAAQKLLLVLSEKYVIGDSEVYATPSIGIAVYPESGETADRLIKAADLAMAEAKKRGGSRFQYYSESLNAKLAQREELEIGLRHALVRNEFVLHYQPRIDVTTGRLIGLEALLRWQHPRFGLLAPARFLSILESSGLIHSAGEWVIATACRQLAAWQRRFELPDLSVAINLSTQQLMHQRLVDTVKAALDDTAIDPGCLELEIGDGNIVRRRELEDRTLAGLRRLGVRISLDHFGTRDISFESLDNGFVDSFVLDRALITDIDVNHSHQRIVRAAVAMAQGLDIEVTAEGVETLTQLEFLKSCHCDLVQGFLISKPVQPEKVSAILRSEIAGTRLLARGMP